MHTCAFCDSQFSTKGSLKNHQKTAKYCIEMQGIDKKELLFNCEFCDKTLTTKYSYDRHIALCKIKTETNYTKIIDDLKKDVINREKIIQNKDKIISELEKRVSNLEGIEKTLEKYLDNDQETIKSIASKTKTSITNKNKVTINNKLDLSQERLISFADNYTMDHFDRGAAGIADWAGENFLLDENKEPLYLCTDKARKTFSYIDENGEKVRDEKAEKLKGKIKPILDPKIKNCKKTKCEILMDEDDENSEKIEKVLELTRENKNIGADFEKRLIDIITKKS